MSGANCNSDHYLVVSKCRYKIAVLHEVKGQSIPYLGRPQNETEQNNIANYLHENTALDDTDNSIEEKWL